MKKKLRSMSAREFVFRVMLRLGPLKRLAQEVVAFIVRRRRWRQRLNAFYNRLKVDELALFQGLFAKTFKGSDQSVDPGEWTVQFGSANVRMPLRPDKIWLDWDNAVSIAGHDFEIKSTYKSILRSTAYRPRVFFDIGANYGTHSLLFLTNGIRVVSFEPNPACQDEFRDLCKLNNVRPDLVPEAVGDRPGEIDYLFPERETWLGSTVEATQKGLMAEHDVRRISVKMGTVDDFVSKSGVAPDLIKIDTEGNEANVLRGAASTIRTERPIIIFEANRLVDREELWDVIVENGNVICSLPFGFESKQQPLSRAEFLASSEVNFIALPGEHNCIEQQIAPAN